MGTVYLAEHTLIKRKVAIKSLKQDLIKNEQLRERFKKEATALAQLEHPNIVRLNEYIEQQDGVFLIMEYVDGLPLDEHINNVSGPINEEQLIPLFLQILDAFEYAHKNKIVHRDIKPSNIIITKDGKIKILDFGIAKIMDETNSMTKTGTQMGSVLYMSPEQVRGEKVNHLSDIYSLGVTLFQMATGKAPYDPTSNEYQIFQKIDKEALPKASSIYPGISKKLEEIIEKSTNKNSFKRFQYCSEFKKALIKKDLDKTIISEEEKNLISNQKISTDLKTKTSVKDPSAKKNRKKIIPLIIILLLIISVFFISKINPSIFSNYNTNLDVSNFSNELYSKNMLVVNIKSSKTVMCDISGDIDGSKFEILDFELNSLNPNQITLIDFSHVKQNQNIFDWKKEDYVFMNKLASRIYNKEKFNLNIEIKLKGDFFNYNFQTETKSKKIEVEQPPIFLLDKKLVKILSEEKFDKYCCNNYDINDRTLVAMGSIQEDRFRVKIRNYILYGEHQLDWPKFDNEAEKYPFINNDDIKVNVDGISLSEGSVRVAYSYRTDEKSTRWLKEYARNDLINSHINNEDLYTIKTKKLTSFSSYREFNLERINYSGYIDIILYSYNNRNLFYHEKIGNFSIDKKAPSIYTRKNGYNDFTRPEINPNFEGYVCVSELSWRGSRHPFKVILKGDIGKIFIKNKSVYFNKSKAKKQEIEIYKELYFNLPLGHYRIPIKVIDNNGNENEFYIEGECVPADD